MPKLISEQTKQSQAFNEAKGFDLNSREAARYCKFFSDENDYNNTETSVKQILLMLSQEPKINKDLYKHSLRNDGVEYTTRSKLVMEYARQSRMLSSIIKLRNANKKLCDAILSSVSKDEASASSDRRAFVLAAIAQRVTP